MNSHNRLRLYLEDFDNIFLQDIEDIGFERNDKSALLRLFKMISNLHIFAFHNFRVTIQSVQVH